MLDDDVGGGVTELAFGKLVDDGAFGSGYDIECRKSKLNINC